MIKRVMAFSLSGALAFVPPVLAAPVAPNPQMPIQRELITAHGQGFTLPINFTSTDLTSFTGRLQVMRFAVQDNQLVAVGIVTGTLVDASGVVRGVIQTVVIPVNLTPGARPVTAKAAVGVPTAAQACDILHLDLAPLDLNLLGLAVHLDRVVLDLSAVPGAGNLLGNLLCAITNLLNGVGTLTQVANLLNQVISILTAA